MSISESLKSFFHDEGIHSTTIQPEFLEVYIKLNASFLHRSTFGILIYTLFCKKPVYKKPSTRQPKI